MSGRVLVVGLELRLYKKVEPLLGRSPLSVDRVPKGESGVLLCHTAAFDLLLLRHPLPDMTLGSFMAEVHSPGALNGGTPILVLTEANRLDELRSLLPGGAKQVLDVERPAAYLQEVASRLLKIAPRVGARIPVKAEVRLENPKLVTCQSENVSEAGMLLRSDTLYPIGTRLGLEISLPSDRKPIQIEAEVVRHTAAEVEVHGIGVHFVSFKGDGAYRLKRFLDGREAG